MKLIEEILENLRNKAPGYELYERKSLEKEVRGYIKSELRRYNELENIDVLTRAINKSEKVMKIAENNVELLLDRGTNLEELNERGEALMRDAEEFDRGARKLKNTMKWYKRKQVLFLTGGVSAVGTFWWFFF